MLKFYSQKSNAYQAEQFYARCLVHISHSFSCNVGYHIRYSRTFDFCTSTNNAYHAEQLFSSRYFHISHSLGVLLRFHVRYSRSSILQRRRKKMLIILNNFFEIAIFIYLIVQLYCQDSTPGVPDFKFLCVSQKCSSC